MDRLLTEASVNGHGATISIPGTPDAIVDPLFWPALHPEGTNQLSDLIADQNVTDPLTPTTTLLF